MTRVYALAAFIVVVFGALAVLAGNVGPDRTGDTPIVLAQAGVTGGDEAQAGGRMVVARDRTGQFRLDAAVNGEDANFLVDTGADVVAVGPDEAERLGIAFDPAQFTPIMKTASGTGRGMVTTIERLEVGGRELRDVPVAVVEGLQMNLLGQSALQRMGRIAVEGDRMVIG